MTAPPIWLPVATPAYPGDCAAWNGSRCVKVVRMGPEDLRSDKVGPPCLGRTGTGILGCFEPRQAKE